MNLFNPEEFRDPIEDMCDDVIRRIEAVYEGCLEAMEPDDLYICKDIVHDEAVHVTKYSTVMSAPIVSGIKHELVEAAPDYMLEIVVGAVRSLTNKSAFRCRRSTTYVPDHASARNHVIERMLLGSGNISAGSRFEITRSDLGTIGLASLEFEKSGEDWRLQYRTQTDTVLFRF